MRFSRSDLSLLILALGVSSSAFAQSAVIANAPVKNFRLPTFNDEGNRTTLLTGSEARHVSDTQIDISELKFTQFRGDGTTVPTNIILAPSASVFHQANNQIVLSGHEGVRLIGERLEATGLNWNYDHTAQRLVLQKNVRVIFQAEIKGILD